MTRTNPHDDILRELAKARRPLSVAELIERTGWGRTATRETLRFYWVGWMIPKVRVYDGESPYRFGLTGAGLDFARKYNLTKRTKPTKLEAGG